MPGASATVRTSPTATFPRRCTPPSPPPRPPGYRMASSRVSSPATSGGGSLEKGGRGEGGGRIAGGTPAARERLPGDRDHLDVDRKPPHTRGDGHGPGEHPG